MPPGGDFQLIHTRINVEGESGDVQFSDLVIEQRLADVNDFSFTWRAEGGELSLANHIAFYQRTLGKETSIHIGDNFTFKGIICAVKCINQHELGSEYEIIGKGLFAKLDYMKECSSFTDKTISQVFNALNTANGTRLTLDPNRTDEIDYMVQYNHTTFDFYKMLATTLGEWLFYNGLEMRLGNPNSAEHVVHIGSEIDNVMISSSIGKSSFNTSGFDRHKGEEIKKTQNSRSERSGLIDAGIKAGERTFPNDTASLNFPRAGSSRSLEFISGLRSKGIAAATVFLTATSTDTVLTLGDKVKIMDEQNHSSGEYYVTVVKHSCENDHNYISNFTAVPTEIDVPPYTDVSAVLHTPCYEQAGVVTDNDDPDGLDRIKVRFPWQAQSESTPWISIMTPYAGKDKGFRFIPEINEEVLVGFVENNPLKPYMIGAFHTDNNKSNHPHEGNHVKIISSKDGRRLLINDDKGAMVLADNYAKTMPFNIIRYQRKDADIYIAIQSCKSENAYSSLQLKGGENIHIGLINGGVEVTKIVMDSGGKNIAIKSKGSVDIDADQTINLSAGTINIKASQELNLEGSSSGVSIKGMKVAINADTSLDAKGVDTTISGSAQLELKGGAMAAITAALVKIN